MIPRRTFLKGAALSVAGTLGAGTLAAACGGAAPGDDPLATGGPPATPLLAGDPGVARLAAGLEQLAIDVYDSLIEAATENRLGPVPALVGTVVTLARAHHEQHLDVWNEVLAAAGEPEVTAADAGLEPTIGGMVAEVADAAGAARMALLMEEILADTYLKAIPTLGAEESMLAAARILAVDQQRQVALRYLLGENPVPEPVQVPDMAAS